MTEHAPTIAERDYIGRPLRRREDAGLLSGEARFYEDIVVPGMAFSSVLRSPHPHALLKSIDTTGAKQNSEVIDVLTFGDISGDLGNIVPNWLVPGMVAPRRPALADGVVRYVGEPVAFVVAKSREAARDALELIDVEYEQLPHVTDEEKALAKRAAQLHGELDSNLCGTYRTGGGDWEEAKERSDQIVKLRIVNNRLIPSPIEPRGVLAVPDQSSDKLTVYLPSQVPHLHRRWIAEVLRLSESRLRLIAPHIGGGFGAKMHLYSEEILVGYAARRLGCAIRWTETRSEALVATTHGRAHIEYIEAAVTNDGRVLGLCVKAFANMGAYLSNMATGIPTINCLTFATGSYNIPTLAGETNLVFTNTVPVDAYRGAGRPEAAYLIERTMDAVASKLGLDPADVRETNLIEQHEVPYALHGSPIFRLDSGSFRECFFRAKKLIDYPTWRFKQEEFRAEGRYVGIAVTNYTELCGVGRSALLQFVGFDRGGFESAEIRVHADGTVTLATGSVPQGQGHATSFAQIVAAELEIPIEDVEVVCGDTSSVPIGIGTYNSRSMAVGGSAAKECAALLLQKATRFAALQLGAAASDIQYENGLFSTTKSKETVTFQSVSAMASRGWGVPPGDSPGLEAIHFYDPAEMSSPNGSHAAVVEVDIETGNVEILDYVAVDDAGVLINPLLAEGQILGGVAQGIGQALYEDASYDSDGHLHAQSFTNYNVPRASQIPTIRSTFLETPTETNPLGSKGVGEAGSCAAPQAIVAAVCDALSPFGITHIDMPLTPERVWEAIRTQRGPSDDS